MRALGALNVSSVPLCLCGSTFVARQKGNAPDRWAGRVAARKGVGEPQLPAEGVERPVVEVLP